MVHPTEMHGRQIILNFFFCKKHNVICFPFLLFVDSGNLYIHSDQFYVGVRSILCTLLHLFVDITLGFTICLCFSIKLYNYCKNKFSLVNSFNETLMLV